MEKSGYNLIYADPPWSYKNGDRAFKSGSATDHYRTMSLVDIQSINIPSITADDAACFLWVTAPCLPEGLSVLRAWGFQYKTIAFSWVKVLSNLQPLKSGMGSYTRSNVELCLLGTRGRLPVKNHSVPQIVFAPRQEHSRKPAIVRQRIVELYGELPRIELFARQWVDGWENNGTTDILEYCGASKLIEVELECDDCGWHEKFIIQENDDFYCSQCGRKYGGA